MDRKTAKAILEQVATGRKSIEAAVEELALAPCAELLDLTLDLHRPMRGGLPEVIFCPGKSSGQLKAAVERLKQAGQPVLATRCSAEQHSALSKDFPEAGYDERSRLFWLGADPGLAPPGPAHGQTLGGTAGASDRPVALEAYGAARFFGLDAGLIADVGVAGLHRLSPHLQALTKARLLICVAGMEGALPSVIAGITGRPVIAVPTSVGYGASFGGLAALLAMLNSCAAGVCVVNIDNGFGAAAMAAKLLRQD